MKAATLTALKGSIAKWKAIVAGTGVDRGIDNCPLCKMFYKGGPAYADSCKGCPVARKTGLAVCEGSPYIDWLSFGFRGFPLKAKTKIQKLLAAAELKFLRSLLPKPKRSAKPAKHGAGK